MIDTNILKKYSKYKLIVIIQPTIIPLLTMRILHGIIIQTM